MTHLTPQTIGNLGARPFLRWAGGKGWLTSRLPEFLPRKFNNYHEPFLGGGSVFFSLKPSNAAYLSDANADLINAYRQIKKSPDAVIKHLHSFQNSESDYYAIRAAIPGTSDYEAARFIYLNKTCYNGIFRVNKSGKFNVPYGHNEAAPIFDRQNLLLARRALRNARVSCHDFAEILERVERNDLVFLDPPYTVAHNNNGFVEYNQNIFTWNDQERLAEVVASIDRRGAKFILTNAVHESIRNLYRGLGKRFELGRFSTITSAVSERRQISEYVITNAI
jgi:DNA adenine methylase